MQKEPARARGQHVFALGGQYGTRR